MKLQTIVLETDFSSFSSSAYPLAAALARRHGARLHLARCVDYPYQYTFAGLGGIDGALRRYCDLLRRKLETEAKLPVFAGIPLEHRLLSGYSSEAIQRFAEEIRADLVVQASHGYRGFKRLLLGSFAEGVIRQATVPVLTLKAPEGTGQLPVSFEPRRILFPLDFSDASRAALDALRFLARSYGSKVLLLHAWIDASDFLPAQGLGGEPITEELLSVSENLPDRLLSELKSFQERELAGLAVEAHLVRGDPAATILERADAHEADLICMATHGWSGLRRLILGSVAEKVVRGASCPVLTVRPPAEKLGQVEKDAAGIVPTVHPIV